MLKQAKPDSALDAAQQAASLADAVGNRSYKAAALRVASKAALEMGELPLAEELITNAESSLSGAMDDLETGHVAAQAYWIYQRAGKIEQAQENLSVAREIYNRLGMNYFLNQLLVVFTNYFYL